MSEPIDLTEVERLRAQIAAVRAVVAESQRITLTVSNNRDILAALGEVERCPWYTDGNSWALWGGPPAKLRCVLFAGHGDDHRPSSPR